MKLLLVWKKLEMTTLRWLQVKGEEHRTRGAHSYGLAKG